MDEKCNQLLSSHLNRSMTNEPTPPADEDCVIWLRAPEMNCFTTYLLQKPGPKYIYKQHISIYNYKL